jgi:hypothetical protein
MIICLRLRVHPKYNCSCVGLTCEERRIGCWVLRTATMLFIFAKTITLEQQIICGGSSWEAQN